MDQQTTNILIGSISAIGTVAAAVIYFHTLNELKKQRANTYKPHLFINNARFHVNGIRRDNITMPIRWMENPSRNEAIETYNPLEFLHNRFYLKCYNIGFGTATKVNIEFFYEIEDFISQIKKLEENISEEFHVTIENVGVFISFKSKNNNLPYIGLGLNRESELKRYVSYILPAHIDNAFSLIELPCHFLELMNIYIFYISMLTQNENIETNIPLITVKMNHTDIANLTVFKTLSIRTELSMYGSIGYNGEFVIIEGE